MMKSSIIKRFVVLDSFRGIAALMVAIFHLKTNGIITNLDFVKNSYLFVEFFFVLSGFVIGCSNLNKINNASDLKVFVIKRFARIYPLHLFMTLMFIPFALASMFLYTDISDRFSIYSLITNLTLTQALGLNSEPTWNLPSWSISVEFYTYIIFGILLITTQLKSRVSISLFISILSLIILFNYSDMGDGATFAIFRCCYSFFLGVIAFQLHDKVSIKPWMEISIIAILVFYLSTYISPSEARALLSPFLFFVVIVVFSHESGSISTVLKLKPFKMLGLLSFSIYLTHAWFVSSLKSISVITSKYLSYNFMIEKNNGRIIDFGYAILNDLILIPYLFVVIVFSWVTYNHIEKKYQDKLTRSIYSNNMKVGSPVSAR
ncbi:acyltransferase [Aeromonas veronii]|uniref:acyltransferase family protein n=1 Tax=Aeromonas veronii TaxID=654 RepID=UPI0030045791